MGSVCLLETAQFLQYCNRIGHHRSHFLFHPEFLTVLAFYHSNCQKNSALQRYAIERNVVHFIVYTMNYLQLVAPMMSRRCQLS